MLKSGYVARSTQTVLALYRVRKSSVSSRKLRVVPWQWIVYRDVEHISLLRSMYYYMFYAVRGLRKNLI